MGFALAQPTIAKTYKLPIEGGRNILKGFVQGGEAKQVGQDGTVALFEVTMETDACTVGVTVVDRIAYGRVKDVIDICREKGFGIIRGY